MQKRVRKGEPLKSIKAQTFNTMIDAGEFFKRHRQNLQARVTPEQPMHQTVVLCKNETGEDLDSRGLIVGLGRPLFNANDNEDQFYSGIPCIKGETPDIEKHYGKFGVTLEPIPDGKIGRICIAGVCVAKIIDTMGSGVPTPGFYSYDRCDIADGDTSGLTNRARGGAGKILYADYVSPDYLALIHLGQTTPETIVGNGIGWAGNTMTGSGLVVPCDSSNQDWYSWEYDSATNTFTCKRPGFYRFDFQLRCRIADLETTVQVDATPSNCDVVFTPKTIYLSFNGNPPCGWTCVSNEGAPVDQTVSLVGGQWCQQGQTLQVLATMPSGGGQVSSVQYCITSSN